jgi:DNA-directed RNA polymerase alpha subunit
MGETPKEFRSMTTEEFESASKESLRLKDRGAVINPDTGSLNVPQELIDSVHPEATKKLLAESIGIITLSEPRTKTRFLRIIRNNGVRNIEDLTKKTYLDLLRLPGLGRKTANEVEQWLNDRGLSLAPREASDDYSFTDED